MKVAVVPTPLDDLLRQRFDELGITPTRLAWAERLGNVDKGTLSRILNGAMPLTSERARKWAGFLFEDDALAEDFARQMVEVADQGGQPRSIPAFFDAVVAEGGAVPAERMADLLRLLPTVRNPLLLIEYRDIPRAGPQAKYQKLGEDLGRAIADGLTVGLFMPFKPRTSFAPTDFGEPTSKGERFMEEVRNECRIAFRNFRNQARSHLSKSQWRDLDEQIKLYEPDETAAHTLASGIQSKMFYLQYDTEAEETLIRHHRIMQWVATPTRDLLIYRGELMIPPAALRDTFYPVPHWFEVELKKEGRGKLPRLPREKSGEAQRREVLKSLKPQWEGFGLPIDRTLWSSIDAP